MIGACLLYSNISIKVVISTFHVGVKLRFANVLLATTGNQVQIEGHELKEIHGILAETIIFLTEGVALTAEMPFIESLISAMILVE